jgi:hypothetical protein
VLAKQIKCKRALFGVVKIMIQLTTRRQASRHKLAGLVEMTKA